VAVALGLASAAEGQVVQDFKHLCMDTHADPTAAFAAADAAGWTVEPSESQAFASVSGNPDGRVIDWTTPNFRAVTATIPVGDKPHKACFIIARADFAKTATALNALLAQPPSKQTDEVWTWDMFAIGGGFQALSHFTDGQSAQLSLDHPMVNVMLLPLEGHAVIVQYTEDTVLTGSAPGPLAADAGDVMHFRAWIEQDGQHIPLAGEVHLKKRPFSIVLRGSHALNYSIVSSVDKRAIPGKPSEADFQDLFNRFAVGAEPDRDTELFVNQPYDSAPYVRINQIWEESEADHLHRFQSYTIDAAGVATARHDIDRVLYDHGPAVPISQWSRGPIYILITGDPVIAGFPHVDPKYAELVFN
jgi:hypothetical protein